MLFKKNRLEKLLLNVPFIVKSGLDRNRTCIWSFGNSYTIHCTTRPFYFFLLYYPRPNDVQPGGHCTTRPFHSLNDAILLAKILTAMASKITPKNFLMTIKPLGPKAFSIQLSDFKTRKIITRLIRIPRRIFTSR